MESGDKRSALFRIKTVTQADFSWVISDWIKSQRYTPSYRQRKGNGLFATSKTSSQAQTKNIEKTLRVFSQGGVNLARDEKREAGKAEERIAQTAAKDYRSILGGTVCLVMAWKTWPAFSTQHANILFKMKNSIRVCLIIFCYFLLLLKMTVKWLQRIFTLIVGWLYINTVIFATCFLCPLRQQTFFSAESLGRISTKCHLYGVHSDFLVSLSMLSISEHK